MITPHHEFRIRFALFVETIETILPHLQEISRRPASSLITGVIIQVCKITQNRNFLFFYFESIGGLLMLGVHPVGITTFHNNFRCINARRDSRREIACGRLADDLFDDFDGPLKILLLFVSLLHVAIVMNPRLCADLMPVVRCFFEDFWIILDRDAGGEKRGFDLLFFENLEETINTNSFAKLTIGNGAQVLFSESIFGKTAAVLLLLCIGPAQVLWPSLKSNARRDGDARSVGPLNRLSLWSYFHNASRVMKLD